MEKASLTRSQAVKALKRLIAVRRPSPQDTAGDIFHFGIVPAGFPERKQDRPPEEHRSIVLVTAAVLDQALESAILTKLPGISPGNEGYVFSDDAAPLRDLDAKIRIGFALGLFGEGVRSDLSLMRTIRNTFAHSRLDINFNTPEIAEACTHFTLRERAPSFISEPQNPCQTFIEVGWEYAVTLIVPPKSDDDLHAALILGFSSSLPKPKE